MTALEQGFMVMLLGMGIVFLLLIVLVLGMGIMSRVVARINSIWPEPHTAGAAASSASTALKKVASTAPSGLDEDEALAIVIALAIHKRKLAESQTA